MAEKDLIQIEIEDLILRQGPLHLKREQDLGELALEGLLGVEQEVAGHLHGDGASALCLRAGGGEAQQGAADADRIHPAVLEEAGILGREKGVDHQLRDVFVGDRAAALDAELRDQAAVAAEDPQRLLELDLAQTLDARKLRGMNRHEDARAEETQCEQLAKVRPRRRETP